MALKSIEALLASKGMEQAAPALGKDEIAFVLAEHEADIRKILKARLVRAEELLKRRPPEIAKRIFDEGTRIPEGFRRPSQSVSLTGPPADAVIIWSTRTRSFDFGTAGNGERLSPPNNQFYRWFSASHPATGGLSIEAAVGQLPPNLRFPGDPSVAVVFLEGNQAIASVYKYFLLPSNLLPALFYTTAHIDIAVGGIWNPTRACGQDLGRTDIGPYLNRSTSALLGNVFSTTYQWGSGGQARCTFLMKEGDYSAEIDLRSFDITTPTVFIPRPNSPNAFVLVAIDACSEAYASGVGAQGPGFAAMDYTGDFPGSPWPEPLFDVGHWYGKICVELQASLYVPLSGIANWRSPTE